MEAKQRASQPYAVFLLDEEDTLASLFDPKDRTVLNMVAALRDGSVFLDETSATTISLKISADHELLQAL